MKSQGDASLARRPLPDVAFHEDDCRIREPERQQLLAYPNNLTIGLIRQCDFKYVREARRFFAAHYNPALRLVLE
jgi:hypothetical protein